MPDRVDAVRPILAQFTDPIQQMRDCVGGTHAIWAGGEKYLPRNAAEKVKDFERRARFTEFYNVTKRTIVATVGQVFAREPVLGEDVPATFLDHAEYIDGDGNHLRVFAALLFIDGLTAGYAGVLVDAPVVEGSLSLAEEEARGIRPYWVPVRAEDIVSYAEERFGAKQELTMLTLRSLVDERVGQFGYREVTEYRVWRLEQTDAGARVVTVETYRLLEAPQGSLQTATEYASTGVKVIVRNCTRIPYAPYVSDSPVCSLAGPPPLLDLSDVNLGHYRTSADRRWLMHLACVPVPVRKGYVAPQEGNRPMRYGTNVLQDLPKDGDFFWRSPDVGVFAPAADELRRLEHQMSALGMAFMSSESNVAETAEAKRIDASASRTTAAMAAERLDDCIELAMSFHCEMIGQATIGVGGMLSGGSFKTNREFDDAMLAPDDVRVLGELRDRGDLSRATMWQLLKEGNRLPAAFDNLAEAQRIADEANPLSVVADSEFDALFAAGVEAQLAQRNVAPDA